MMKNDNGTVQSHYQEVSKLNSTFNANSDAHTIKDNKIIKIPLKRITQDLLKTNKV